MAPSWNQGGGRRRRAGTPNSFFGLPGTSLSPSPSQSVGLGAVEWGGGDKGNLSVTRQHSCQLLEAGTDAGLLKPTIAGSWGIELKGWENAGTEIESRRL